MPRSRITVTVRADPTQHAAWVAAARGDGRSLANWIERCCDSAAELAPGKPSKRGKRRKARSKPARDARSMDEESEG